TTLKRSRSAKRTVTRPPVRSERNRAWSSRSRTRLRFGSPVSGSWVAWRTASSKARRIPSTAAASLRAREACSATARRICCAAGVGLVEDPEAGGVVAEQSGRPFGDRVEHLADGHAVRDRPLDAEEPLEERLAFLEDGDEPLVLLHVAQGLEAQRPLVVEGAE